jgi:pteridine reductase
MSEYPLRDKRVLITGAARRLGRAFALACARAGADVVIHHGHSLQAAQDLMAEIQLAGGRAHIIQADLADAAETARLGAEMERLGPVDALVNSAAIFEPLSAVQTSRDDWDRHIAINLTAPFILSQAFARQLPAELPGTIVNILDWRAIRPPADHFPYTISKAALAAMTQSLAIELAPRIRVNGLALGAILPPSDASVSERILNRIPLKRWAEPGEAEAALLFLLAGAGYVTGEILLVDGGRHLA